MGRDAPKDEIPRQTIKFFDCHLSPSWMLNWVTQICRRLLCEFSENQHSSENEGVNQFLLSRAHERLFWNKGICPWNRLRQRIVFSKNSLDSGVAGPRNPSCFVNCLETAVLLLVSAPRTACDTKVFYFVRSYSSEVSVI